VGASTRPRVSGNFNLTRRDSSRPILRSSRALASRAACSVTMKRTGSPAELELDLHPRHERWSGDCRLHRRIRRRLRLAPSGTDAASGLAFLGCFRAGLPLRTVCAARKLCHTRCGITLLPPQVHRDDAQILADVAGPVTPTQRRNVMHQDSRAVFPWLPGPSPNPMESGSAAAFVLPHNDDSDV
jgi:hypothetical protein